MDSFDKEHLEMALAATQALRIEISSEVPRPENVRLGGLEIRRSQKWIASVAAWLEKQTQTYIDEVVKAMGKASGTALVGIPAMKALQVDMHELTNQICQWLHSINIPF